MAIAADSAASACFYIASISAWTGEGVQFTAVLPHDGTYHLWARAKGEGWKNNSFFVAFDDGAGFHYEVPDVAGQWAWSWARVHEEGKPEGPFTLTAGAHTLHFRNREPDTRLDAVLLTDAAALTPGFVTVCPTAAPTTTPTPSATAASTATATPSATPSATPTPSFTPSPTASRTPTATPSPTPSPSPTLTATPTVTPSPSSTPTHTATDACADGYEPDDLPSQARAAMIGATELRTFHRTGDRDYLWLEADAGSLLEVKTWISVLGVDTSLTILAADGATELAFNDDDPARLPASTLVWPVEETGRYFVVVGSKGSQNSGCDAWYWLFLSEPSYRTWLTSIWR